MIVYLTFNDTPSGIYESQVKDVVKFLNVNTDSRVQLVAFISLRNFLANRKKIRQGMKQAIVIPMWPGISNWKFNALTLKLLLLFKKVDLIIARSVLSTQLAFKTGKKVVYDGRGAIEAEWKEYQVIQDPNMLQNIHQWEKECIQRSQFRLAVSEKLIEYWRSEFGYDGQDHVVIPCTLNDQYIHIPFDDRMIRERRKKLGYEDEDIVLIYSGSVAGWQSFRLLHDFLKPLLQEYGHVKVLFLSGPDSNIEKLRSDFPQQINSVKVDPSDVPLYLLAGDYGLLIREESVTNQVASPVKFAEYLSCGLKVIISHHLGDYSEFVVKNKCGHLFDTPFKPERTGHEEKSGLRGIALKHFTKEVFITQYSRIVRITN